jgi:hypothetical protein
MTKIPNVIVRERIVDEFLNQRHEVVKRANGSERRGIRRAAKATSRG